jgi:hypothetical protein
MMLFELWRLFGRSLWLRKETERIRHRRGREYIKKEVTDGTRAESITRKERATLKMM